MLDHWLQPINLSKIDHFEALDEECLGRKITLHTVPPLRDEAEGIKGAFPNLEKTQIALIGIGNEDSDAVRAQLYALSFPFKKLNIADLGNVRKQETSFITPLLAELIQGNILPIIIGHSEIFTLSQYQAYQNRKAPVSVGIVDEKIRFTPKVKADSFFLHQILEDKHLFNCSIMGYQTHFAAPSVLDWFDKKSFELVRVGKVKNALEDIEPVVRDADMLSFSLSALKNIEAPGQVDGTPSGFFSEEACQIMRYAGMSDKTTSLGIYGFQKKIDKTPQTARVIAQMIWYFLDGFYNRKGDFPIQKAFNHLTQYIVDIKSVDYQVTFWKSNKSGRWWMEVPIKTRKKHERHRLVPCSYNDYLQACNEDLPDRLINAYRRFK
jgi:formiminoglutamase